ncbi:MAG: hypothetical protein Q8P11_00465 [bacterium]|nr:hypothetical protein [bacterium]
MILSAPQSILATLHYFDISDYPLTLEEVQKYAYCPPMELADIATVLQIIDDVLIPGGYVTCQRGLYSIAGRSHIVDTRLERYEAVHKKYKKAMRFGSMLAMVPFVRMVAVCSSLSFGNARDESDIDLHILVRHGHIWLVRFFCSTVMEILGQRPNIATREKKNALCLSFFTSDRDGDCSTLARAPHADVVDVEFVYWISQHDPLYDSGDYYERWYKKNTWITQWIPFHFSKAQHPRRTIQLAWWQRGLKRLSEYIVSLFGNWLEKLAHGFQMKILPLSLKQHLSTGTQVVMNDDVLKMHPHDTREQTQQEFIKRVEIIKRTDICKS